MQHKMVEGSWDAVDLSLHLREEDLLYVWAEELGKVAFFDSYSPGFTLSKTFPCEQQQKKLSLKMHIFVLIVAILF